MSTEFNAWAPVREEEIASYAYSLWEADGRPHGRDQYFWYQAKALLTLAHREEASAQQAKSVVAEVQAPKAVGKLVRQSVAPVKNSVPKKAKKRELEAVGV